MTNSLAFFQKSLMLVVYLSLPVLAVAVITGVVLSLVQAILSIQDQSLPFAIKLMAVSACVAMMGPWMGGRIVALGTEALSTIELIRVDNSLATR